MKEYRFTISGTVLVDDDYDEDDLKDDLMSSVSLYDAKACEVDEVEIEE